MHQKLNDTTLVAHYLENVKMIHINIKDFLAQLLQNERDLKIRHNEKEHSGQLIIIHSEKVV